MIKKEWLEDYKTKAYYCLELYTENATIKNLAKIILTLIKDIESNQVEAQVGKRLLTELRKHYLVEIDIETGEPKANMKTLMKLWDEVNTYLEIKTIGKI